MLGSIGTTMPARPIKMTRTTTSSNSVKPLRLRTRRDCARFVMTGSPQKNQGIRSVTQGREPMLKRPKSAVKEIHVKYYSFDAFVIIGDFTDNTTRKSPLFDEAPARRTPRSAQGRPCRRC